MTPKSCEEAFKGAQKLARTGHLRDARKMAQSCDEKACGHFLQQQCMALAARIDLDTPTIVPSVTDPDGNAVVDIQLRMDGVVVARQIDGRALRVDPGVHEFSFETDDGVVAEKKIVVLQGQHNRPLAVRVEPADDGQSTQPPQRPVAAAKPKAIADADEPDKPAETEAEHHRSNGYSYLLMATGVAGIAGYATFTYWGRKDNDQLAQCAPNCPQSALDHINHLYLTADISLGVGLPALLLGGYLWYRNDTSSSSYAVDVRANSSGVFASVKGAF